MGRTGVLFVWRKARLRIFLLRRFKTFLAWVAKPVSIRPAPTPAITIGDMIPERSSQNSPPNFPSLPKSLIACRNSSPPRHQKNSLREIEFLFLWVSFVNLRVLRG